LLLLLLLLLFFHAGIRFEVQAEAWSWAPSSGSNAPAQQQQLPDGHLGGLMVNGLTCRLTSGYGPAVLKLHLQGSAAEPTVLTVPLQVEAGPVAPDGLWLRQVMLEPPQQAAAAAVVGQVLDVMFEGVLQDRTSWQFMPEVKEEPGGAAAAAVEEEEDEASEEQQDEEMQDAAAGGAAAGLGAAAEPAAAAAMVKPDPDAATQQQQQQQPECIELLDTDSDDEVMILDSPPPPQQQPPPPPPPQQQPAVRRRRRQQRLSARARQLAALDPAAAALLYRLPALAEGSMLRLTVHLRDAASQAISADRGGKLRLLHHRGWQQQQQGLVEELQVVPVSKGQVELLLRIGVGDEWLGEQLFEIAPAAPTTQLAAAAAARSELSKALPVLLQLHVEPGNHPSSLLLKSDLVAAASSLLVSAGEAAAAAAPATFLQQYTADSINASLSNCQLHGRAAAAAAVGAPGSVLVLQLQDENTPPAAAAVAMPLAIPSELPGFTVGIAARDRQPLPLQGLGTLQLQLLRWQAPLQQQLQGAVLDPNSCWVPVPGCSEQAAATLPAAPAADAEAADPAAAAAAVAASMEPQFVIEAGCVELPRQAGLYKLEAVYVPQQQQQQRGRAAPGKQGLVASCSSTASF
jgi:hypothetical protein